MTNETVGPYRVLQCLLVGDVERLGCEAPNGDRVVLRRRGAASPGATAAAEAVTLALGRHRHVTPVLDVLTDSRGSLVVVSPETGGPTLGEWLDRRGRPEPGELVTILAPVLLGLHHLGRRGAAVTRLGLDDVEIDELGAPVIVSARVATDAADPVAVTTTTGVEFVHRVEQRSGVAVLARVDDDTTRVGETGTGPSLDDLVERVFDLAAPLPLASVMPDPPREGSSTASFADGHDEMPPSWLAVLPESDIVDRLVGRIRVLRRDGLARLVSSVRPRFWILGSAVVIVLVAAAAVNSFRDRETSMLVVASSDSTPSAEASPAPTESRPAESGVTHPTAPDANAPRRRDGTSSDAGGEVTSDEIVVTTQRLIDARLLCLRDATPSCFASVDQDGSPLARVDSEVVDDPGAATAESIRLVVTGELSRLGGSALLSATGPNAEPASILVMRTEAGWRLREVTVSG